MADPRRDPRWRNSRDVQIVMNYRPRRHNNAGRLPANSCNVNTPPVVENPPHGERGLGFWTAAWSLILALLSAIGYWIVDTNARSLIVSHPQRPPCSQMRPFVQLWTFPPGLSAADRTFYSPLSDSERGFNLDPPQTHIDLEGQALHLNTSIEAANEYINGNLACSLMRVLVKGKGQRTSTDLLVVDIASGSRKIDRLLTSMSQWQKVIKDFDRLGRESETAAVQALVSVTATKLGATNRQFAWLRSFFLPTAHKEWSRANERLDNIHQYQTALNQTGQSMIQKREETQTIRDQLRRFSERAQALPGTDTSQIEHWLTGHLTRRFAEEGKSYTPLQREVWLKDLEHWCNHCRSIAGNHVNGVAASSTTP